MDKFTNEVLTRLVASESYASSILHVRAMPTVKQMLCRHDPTFCLDNAVYVFRHDDNTMIAKGTRDKLLERAPYFDTVPSSNVGAHSCVAGISAYRTTHLAQPIVYCLVSVPGCGDAIVAKKGTAYRLHRYFTAMAKRHNTSVIDMTQRPILAPGVMELVMSNTVDFCRTAQKYQKKYNLRLTRGLLLSGTPGNGKSMLCRYLVKLANKHGIWCSSYSASNLADAARSGDLGRYMHRPGLIICDDLPRNYFDRSSDNNEMANMMLAAMDGMYDFHVEAPSVRIFTTNEDPKYIDRAFLRPGRIDVVVTIDPPVAAARRAFIESWPPDLLQAIPVDTIAEKTTDFSFARLAGLKDMLVGEFLWGTGKWDLDAILTIISERDMVTSSSTLIDEDDTFNDPWADGEEAELSYSH